MTKKDEMYQKKKCLKRKQLKTKSLIEKEEFD